MTNFSNPYQAPKIDHTPKTPKEGMRGLYPTPEGWVDIDSSGKVKKLASEDDIANITASQVGAYTKKEVDTKLSQKANKADIVGAYKYIGSVPTFDDLPFAYDLIPNGVPTFNGEACGTYDEATHTVTIDNVSLKSYQTDRIIIPIIPITVVKGAKYFCDDIRQYHRAYIGNLCTYVCAMYRVYEIMNVETISEIEVFSPYPYEVSPNLINGETNYLGKLYKVTDSWIEENDTVYIPDGAVDNGSVYEVTESGMNYAWNGSTWDALGTSHIDQEAREDIKELSDSLSCIDINDSNISFNGDKNTVGITKELGSFVCTAIDEDANKYTFDVADTSVFEPSTEYKVTVGDADYLIRTSEIGYKYVVFVAVDAENKPTFDVGTAYSIRFETKNATSFGVNNTVYANEGFATGMSNFIDETADQGVANGYKNKLSGKAHFVTGSLNNVSEGDRDTIFGASNVVKGNNKFVAGTGLLVEKTSNGSTVLGQYNEDIQDAIFILGNGSSNNRRNALVIDKSGNIIAYGTLTVDKNTTVNGKLNINDATIINGTLDVNGNVSIKGVMNLNGSNVVTEATLLDKHKGIDIGRSGSGIKAVIFNDNNGNENNIASGYASFTAGSSNKTTKDQGATFGYGNENHGQGSFLAGCYSKVNAGADHSAALGLRLTVDKLHQVVVGAHNEPDTTSTFIVGCGKDTRKNAMTVEEGTGFTTFYQDVEVKGKIKGDNVFPKDISFVVNGDITNQDGNLVAEYSDDGKVNFSLDPNEYPYNGRRITDCKTLIIPIEQVTLQAGTYKKQGIYSFTQKDQNGRLVNNGYYLKIFADGTDGVTQTDDTYVISKPTTISEVYLQRDQEVNPKYYGWDFIGSGYLDLSTVQLTDITAGLIGAFEEHKEADGISTSLHLTSPNGTVFKLTVADDGSLTTIRV